MTTRKRSIPPVILGQGDYATDWPTEGQDEDTLPRYRQQAGSGWDWLSVGLTIIAGCASLAYLVWLVYRTYVASGSVVGLA